MHASKTGPAVKNGPVVASPGVKIRDATDRRHRRIDRAGRDPPKPLRDPCLDAAVGLHFLGVLHQLPGRAGGRAPERHPLQPAPLQVARPLLGQPALELLDVDGGDSFDDARAGAGPHLLEEANAVPETAPAGAGGTLRGPLRALAGVSLRGTHAGSLCDASVGGGHGYALSAVCRVCVVQRRETVRY
jgi:hypothetical protein